MHVSSNSKFFFYRVKTNFTCSLVSSTDLASAVAATIPRTITSGPLSLSATIFQTDSPLLSTRSLFFNKVTLLRLHVRERYISLQNMIIEIKATTRKTVKTKLSFVKC
jgi:hypothetical protein